MAFAWSVKAANRYERDAGPVVRTLLPQGDADVVMGARKPPLALLSLLRRATQPLNLPMHESLELQRSLRWVAECESERVSE